MKKVKDKVIGIMLIFIINSITIFMNSKEIINFIVDLIPEGIDIIALSPTELFNISISISLLLSFVIILPLILYYILNFFSDALYEKEKKALKYVLFFGTLLFLLGFTLAFFSFIKEALPFFSEFNLLYGMDTLWSIQKTIESILVLSFSAGLAFELPMVLYYLIKYDLIDFKLNSSSRIFILLFLLILFAFITPDGSMITQFTLTIPIYSLLEISIYMGNKYKLEVKK